MSTKRKHRCFRFGIAGSHSTGKSTFLGRLQTELEKHQFTVLKVGDLATAALEAGQPILTEHTRASTQWIIDKGKEYEAVRAPQCDVLLVDRPVPDALGYLWAARAFRQEEINPPDEAEWIAEIGNYAACYDLLVRTTLDPSIELGPGRDTNTEMRRLAHEKIAEVFQTLQLSALELNANNTQKVLFDCLGAILDFHGR